MSKKKKLYSFADHPDHEAQLPAWRERWVQNTRNCNPMTDEDREIMRGAIAGMYAAAGLAEPDHIVFVSSPLVVRVAGGFAAATWEGEAHDGRGMAAALALLAPLVSSDTEVQRRITSDIISATAEATGGKMLIDPQDQDPSRAAQALDWAIQAVEMWNGGNQWSGWTPAITFGRYVAGLDIDYSKWDHYEKAAIHGGPRVVYSRFCIVSDRPESVYFDDRETYSHPEGEPGPAARYRDGFAVWAVDGVVGLTEQIVMAPETLTTDQIRAENNAEIRRIMVERYGPSKFLVETGAKVLDMDSLGLEGSGPRALMEDDSGDKWLVVTDGSTGRVYHLPAPREAQTARQAHEAMCGFDESLIVAEA